MDGQAVRHGGPFIRVPRGQGCAFLAVGAPTVPSEVQHILHRYIEHSGDRGGCAHRSARSTIPLHQCDVHGELTITFDELLGPIQWIDQPITVPPLSFADLQAASLFAQYRKTCSLQHCNNGLVRPSVRLRQRRSVILQLDFDVSIIHGQYLLTRSQ
jgi:hypothetical protein